MDRKSKMRARKIEHDSLPESESEALSLSPSPAPRIGGNLSSMVVKPSLSSGGGSDLDIGYAANDRPRESPPRYLRRESPLDPHRRDSPASSRRRVVSSPQHRRVSPDPFRRRVSQPGLHRGGPLMGFPHRGSPPEFHPRSQRFQNSPGYLQRSGSISPLHRPRADENYFEQDFGHLRGPRTGRGIRGRGGRFREISPPTFVRGGRSYGRGSNSSARAISPIEEEYVHRNDPNLSPREGDWICRNPSCGNLNFARRAYCNNCHKFRFDEPYGSGHSPRSGYGSPTPPRGFSQRLPVSPIDRGPRRDFNGFRSPPRGWDIDDPREFNTSLIPPRRGGKLLNPFRRESLQFSKDNFRGRGRSNWPVSGDWEPRGRDAFVSNSRGVNRRPLSPDNRWIRDTRGRSRSPVGGRLSRNSFAGRGRDDRRYDGPYAGNGKARDLDASHGRGYRRGGRVRSPDDVF